uniref:Delta-like protein n=1 Tax=Macrostomum lignano TaxID=282301 RepID=A0A1I8HGX7_9PLAT
ILQAANPAQFAGPNCENNIGSCSAAASAAPDGVVCHNGGDCLDKVGGGFRCRCPAGWFGDRCASRANPCQSRPCANSALCRPAPELGELQLRLLDADGGFSGPLSLDDIDECQAAGRCDSDGTQRCLNTVGSFKCVCKPGFVGEHCDRRADRCASVVCLNGGWCDPADGSCRCQPEFDGFDCFRPRDNCFPSPCLNGGQCRTLVDAYVCTCPPGYGGLDCEKVNACSNSSCLGRGTCRVEQRIAASAAAAAGQPDFRCDCHSGFGGQFCQDRIRGGAVLSRGSGCSDSLCSGGRQCPFGYSGRRCESPVNPCDSNPCRRGGTCVAGLANGDPTNYTCLCKPGFQGPHCEANINECANGGRLRPAGTEVCIDGVASFTCRCLPGFTGQLCNRSIDYCLPTATPKPPRCLNGGVCRSDRRQPTPGAVCDCPPATRAALSAHLRSNGGVCEIVGANRTRCICPPGTAGLRCEIDYINSCKSSASPTGESPCHGDQSECRDLPEGFRCRCQPGLCGPTCDRECPTLEEERSSRQWRLRPGLRQPRLRLGRRRLRLRLAALGQLHRSQERGRRRLHRRLWRRPLPAGVQRPALPVRRRRLRRFDIRPSDHEYESYCRDHFADGRCDSGCDTAAYLFDGGDCLPASSTGKLPPQPPTPPPPAGYLKLAVGGRNASGFRPDTAVGRQFVRSLSQRLGCLVQLAAEPSAAVSSGDGTVVLVLVYRLGLCHRPDRCYTSADYAAQALAADLRLESSASSTAAGRRRPRPSLTLPLIGLPAAAPDPLVSRDSMLLPAVVGCVCLSIIAIFIGVLFRTFKSSASSASRSSSIGGGTGRREAGRLWCPPGFQPLNSVSSSGGGCGCGHPDNECPGAAYSMQHRSSTRCCWTTRSNSQPPSEASAAALQIGLKVGIKASFPGFCADANISVEWRLESFQQSAAD